jgi:hypothetical protein
VSRHIAFSSLSLLFALATLPVDAEALGRVLTRIYVNSGLGLSPIPQEYDNDVRLPSVSFAASGGTVLGITEMTSALLELSYFRFAEGEALGGWGSAFARVEPSHVVTAMLGLRVDGSHESRVIPFLTGSIGIGTVTIGDLAIDYLDGTSRTVPRDRKTAPAVAVSAGLRTGSSPRGLHATVSIRFLSVLTDDQATNIVPIAIGLEF